MKLASLVIVALCPFWTLAAETPVYPDHAQPLEARVADLLGRLSLDEKIALLHGDSKFTTAAIPRLGIPRRWLSDGPHGVREEIAADSWAGAGRTDDFATCFPCGLALAATWNPELAGTEGAAIAEEARARGKHIMLGPGVNIMRSPLCGRNFEYFGEDPYLSGRITVGYVKGAQAKNIASCVKHFALNNQETDRNTIDVDVDERTLREIYLPAFEAAVKEAKVWAVMGAYNRVRGAFCCQNDLLLNRILKGEWGFQGLVVSDWNGVHDTRDAALGGLDLEMGTKRPFAEYFFAAPLRAAVDRGEIPLAVIDEKVRRNLRVMIGSGALDDASTGALNTRAHQAAAQAVAEEAMVLLKNDRGVLPLHRGQIRSIAVIGDNAVRLQAHGGASSEIKALYEISPLDGLVRCAGDQVNVTYSVGYGPTASPDTAERAVAAAKTADVVLFVGGLNHDRGYDFESVDRADLRLPSGQDELIAKLAAANPHLVVVLISGGPVAMPWISEVSTVVQAWYGGMEVGTALGRLLFGEANFSGKLPCTFPLRLADSPAHALNAFPGKEGVVRYEEGLLVGYRWFDTKAVAPLFPFGHGLSYTSFAYRAPRVTPHDGTASVELQLANAGPCAGAETVQVYVEPRKPSVVRPRQELKGFQKVTLNAGETRTVTVPLDRRALAYYDPARKAWVAERGEYVIRIGGSSRDIRLETTVNVPETVTVE